MAEIDDLKMILRNADIGCITDAKTFQEQKIRFGECVIFVSSLERREAEIRAMAISEFAEKLKEELRDSIISDEEKFKYERRMQERICAQNVTFKVIIKLVEQLAEQLKEE